jgi:CSLREA domain-containing protein
MQHHLRFLLLVLVLAACSEDQPPTGPTAPGDMAESHGPGHKVVNSLADPGNGVCNAAQCTLREAINDPTSTEITFAAGLTGQITLAPPGAGGGQLDINKQLSITGPTARIAIRGRIPDRPFPVFRIGKQGTAALANLVIRNGGNGVTNRGTLTVENCIISENGTGIANNFSSLTVSRSLIADNGGSGISSAFSPLTLNDLRIVRNGGRGISLFRGRLTLTNGTIARNGGGINNSEGNVTIVGSTIANNSTSGLGGGIANAVHTSFTGRQSALVTLINSTVSGNSASTGGGIHSSGHLGNASVFLQNSTVVRNSATERGGGIVPEVGTDDPNQIGLSNSIVAQNSASTAPDVLFPESDGLLVSASFNLIGDGTGSSLTNTDGNQVGSAAAPIDPKLAPLANYGGPTQTHRLLAGSPAIDAASAADCPATDQRGVPRPQGAGCDIGSFERK